MRHLETTRTRLFLSFLKSSLFAGLACLILTPAASADLLLEDVFDYPVGDINGNNGGIGWNGAWSGFFNAGVSGHNDVLEGSLPFSNFPTQGNRVQMANLASINTGEIARQYSRNSRPSSFTKDSGTLWKAFLYRRIDTNTGSDAWAEHRVNTGFIFGTTAKAGTTSDSFPIGNGLGRGISVRYDNVPDSLDESADIQDGSVYLLIARFTEINVFGGSGTGTMWALSEANYDAIVADGSITEGELDANFTLKDIDDDPGLLPKSILPGYEQRFVNGVKFEDGVYNSLIYEYDELRYGDEVMDVLFLPSDVNADFDSDGDVDGIDFLTWQQGFGLEGGATLSQGDANGDEAVNGTDLGLWQDNFGLPANVGASMATVPEPSTLWLAALSLIFCGRFFFGRESGNRLAAVG